MYEHAQNKQAQKKKRRLNNQHAADVLHRIVTHFVREDSDTLIDRHLIDQGIEQHDALGFSNARKICVGVARAS